MIDLDTILAVVASIFRVSVADIRGGRRFQRHMRARHAVCYLLVCRAGYGVTEAGEMLGRHYTTVSASVDAAEQLIGDDPSYAAQVAACRAALARTEGEALSLSPQPSALSPTKRRDAWVVEQSVHIALYWWGLPEPVTL